MNRKGAKDAKENEEELNREDAENAEGRTNRLETGNLVVNHFIDSMQVLG